MVCNYRLFRIIFLSLLLALAHAVLAQTLKPGPISEAIASRHAYVYGTADNPAPAEAVKRRNPFGIGSPDLLVGMKDYILFKGSVENLIVEGRFDRNWRVPEADATKMAAGGAVTFSGRQ